MLVEVNFGQEEIPENDLIPEDFFKEMRKKLFGIYKEEWQDVFEHFLSDEFAQANEAVLKEQGIKK